MFKRLVVVEVAGRPTPAKNEFSVSAFKRVRGAGVPSIKEQAQMQGLDSELGWTRLITNHVDSTVLHPKQFVVGGVSLTKGNVEAVLKRHGLRITRLDHLIDLPISDRANVVGALDFLDSSLSVLQPSLQASRKVEAALRDGLKRGNRVLVNVPTETEKPASFVLSPLRARFLLLRVRARYKRLNGFAEMLKTHKEPLVE